MSEEFDALARDVLAEPETLDGRSSFETWYGEYPEVVKRHFLGMGEQELNRLQADSEQRFSASLPLDKAHGTTIALVGAGGLGNHIWKVLVGMGFTRLHVFDDDVVGVENVGPQMHKLIDVGLPKVEAVRREALAFRGVELPVHKMKVSSLDDVVREVGRMPDVLIGATDSAEFRNSIIGAFGENRELPLFLDLRMALGDWNCFAFTPKALDIWGDFEDGDDSWYAAYENEAVFDPSEAVQEPCTARAITYTGANVASYVGAFMHWWTVRGQEKCATDKDFLLNSYYSEVRHGNDFNWRYTFGSKEFLPATMTDVDARMTDRAAEGAMLSIAMSNMMKAMWDGDPTCDTEAAPNRASDDVRTEAYLDLEGCHHLYQAYSAEISRAASVSVALVIDLNLTKGTACTSAKRYDTGAGESFWDAEAALRKDAKQCRVHTERLSGDSAASCLMKVWLDGMQLRELAMAVEGSDLGRLPGTLAASAFASNGQPSLEANNVVSVGLCAPKRAGRPGAWNWELKAWKFTGDHLVELDAAGVACELGSMKGRFKYATGWRKQAPATQFVFQSAAAAVNGEREGLVMRDPQDILGGAIREWGSRTETMKVSDMPDGTVVLVGDREYVKMTDEAMPYLEDGCRKLYVRPGLPMRARRNA